MALRRPPAKKQKGMGAAVPTVQQMVRDKLTEIACEYWAPYTTNHKKFDKQVVAAIYRDELLFSNFNIRRVMLLEFSQYLEKFLWPNYNVVESSIEHVLSIVMLVNEKFRERVPAWERQRAMVQQQAMQQQQTYGGGEQMYGQEQMMYSQAEYAPRQAMIHRYANPSMQNPMMVPMHNQQQQYMQQMQHQRQQAPMNQYQYHMN